MYVDLRLRWYNYMFCQLKVYVIIYAIVCQAIMTVWSKQNRSKVNQS